MMKWLAKALLLLTAVGAVYSFTGCSGAKVETPKDLTGKVYTQVNMWENGGHISYVNYSVGRKIPVNSEVKILEMTEKTITFEMAKFPGVALQFDNIDKYSQTGTAELAKQLFGSAKVDLSKFSKKEQEFIASFDGFYKAGISKEAMVVARGYPPKHMTPTLKYDAWKYWRNKWATKIVGFKDNKSVTVNGEPLQ